MPATNGGNGVIILVVIAAVFFIAYTSSVRGNKPSIPSSAIAANVASVQVEQPYSSIDTPTTEQQKWREFWNSAYTDAHVASTKPLWDAGGVDGEILTTVRTLQHEISIKRKTILRTPGVPIQGTPIRILEIGCGEGDNFLALQTLPDTVVFCIDMSSVALSVLRKKGINAKHVLEGNVLESLPSSWINFDVVLMRSVLYHVSPANKILMLRKIHDILRMGGFVVDKEYDQKANQQAAATYNRKTIKTTLGPTYSLSQKEMLGLYAKNKFHLWKEENNHRHQPSKCYVPYIPNVEYVWCQLMVLQKN